MMPVPASCVDLEPAASLTGAELAACAGFGEAAPQVKDIRRA